MIDDKHKTTWVRSNAMTNPIIITESEHGIWHVEYFGKIAGWVQKVQRKVGHGQAYHCLTASGDITYTDSLSAAKDWVVGRAK